MMNAATKVSVDDTEEEMGGVDALMPRYGEGLDESSL
jgi:hypothetical protein